MNKNYTQLSEFYNSDTLNIFSDGSYKNGAINCAAYGVIAVCMDTIIDKDGGPCSNSTIVVAEGRGMISALSMAIKYKDQYKNINIFSDSEITVRAIKEYIYNWKYDPNRGLLNSSNKVAKNQEIYIECLNLLDILGISNTIIKIYHVKGHVTNNHYDLIEASNSFIRENHLGVPFIDMNIMRYITCYNDYADKIAGSMRVKYNRDKNVYNIPIKFVADGVIKKKYNL